MYDLELSAKGVTVKLNAAFIGEDLLVWLSGGVAHIGAVALAVPRQGLRDGDKVSADASIMTVGGHKEDLLARKIALALAAKLNVKVCVSAGLHWDAATPARIEMAKELCGRLAKTLLMHIAKDKEGQSRKSESEETAEKAEAPLVEEAMAKTEPVKPPTATAATATPAQRPASAKPARPAPGQTRDAQGRPVSVRQAVNATLKKPLLNKQ